MNKLSKELIGASSIPIILTIISKNQTYGYEIIQKVKELSNGQIEYGDGTLYPVLHKLEKKGLIKSEWKKVGLERKRKYYSLCEEGKEKLKSEKDNWNLINQIMLKLWKIETSLT